MSTITLFPPIARCTAEVPFDIYDYGMLFNDPGTKKIIREGSTIGCFYIESPGMRSLLRRLNVETFELLTAASSIIRPGVAESGMMREFIRRHKNPKLRTYLIPELQQYLGETYGVMVYQEDVIKVAHHIAGLSLDEADLLRRAMSGKMRSADAMQRIHDRFFESCQAKQLPAAAANELWRQIKSFAGYSFCKSHSAAFALLSFQVAFLKVHHPAPFMAGVLSNNGGYYSHAVYVQEARRLGISVLLPDINQSGIDYIGSGTYIRIGFAAIKNFNSASAETIVAERKKGKFISLLDFTSRTQLGFEETGLLIRCGAMDAFGISRPSLLRLLDIYRHKRRFFSDNSPSLFEREISALEREVVRSDDYSLAQRCRIEHETFGYMVSAHPLEFFPRQICHPTVTHAADMHAYNGKRIKMIGWYMTAKRIKTRSGEIMKFLSLEDLTGTFEAVLFPKTYSLYAEQTLSMGPYLVQGIVDMDSGNTLVVEKLALLTQAAAGSLQAETIKVPAWDSAEDTYSDNEKITEEEVRIAASLNTQKLAAAYLAKTA